MMTIPLEWVISLIPTRCNLILAHMTPYSRRLVVIPRHVVATQMWFYSSPCGAYSHPDGISFQPMWRLILPSMGFYSSPCDVISHLDGVLFQPMWLFSHLGVVLFQRSWCLIPLRWPVIPAHVVRVPTSMVFYSIPCGSFSHLDGGLFHPMRALFPHRSS